MVTSYVKIVVVTTLVRNALGVQQVPPAMVLNGLAIILSLFIMAPVGVETWGLVKGLELGPNPEAADLAALVGGLLARGLLRQGSEGFPEGLVLDGSKLRRFTALSYSERREYLAAGICVTANTPRSALSLYNRSRLLSLAGFISAFMGTLDPNRQYPKLTLIRLMDMLERNGLGRRGEQFGSFALNPRRTRLGDSDFFDSILEALRIAGFYTFLFFCFRMSQEHICLSIFPHL